MPWLQFGFEIRGGGIEWRDATPIHTAHTTYPLRTGKLAERGAEHN
jgi:hypothetical protein